MYESEGIKTWQWVVTVAIIVILIVVGYFVFTTPCETCGVAQKEETTEQFCERIGRYRAIKNLPAACLKYYK